MLANRTQPLDIRGREIVCERERKRQIWAKILQKGGYKPSQTPKASVVFVSVGEIYRTHTRIRLLLKTTAS